MNFENKLSTVKSNYMTRFFSIVVSCAGFEIKTSLDRAFDLFPDFVDQLNSAAIEKQTWVLNVA